MKGQRTSHGWALMRLLGCAAFIACSQGSAKAAHPDPGDSLMVLWQAGSLQVQFQTQAQEAHGVRRQLQQSGGTYTCPMTSLPQGFEVNNGALTLPFPINSSFICFATDFQCKVTDQFKSTGNGTTVQQSATYSGRLVTPYPESSCAAFYNSDLTQAIIIQVIQRFLRTTANKPYTNPVLQLADICVDSDADCPDASHSCTGCPATCPSSQCTRPWYLDTSSISTNDLVVGDNTCCQISNCTNGNAAFRSNIQPGPAPSPPSGGGGGGGSSNLGAIIGGVVGGLVGAGLLAGVIWWFVAKKKRQPQPSVASKDTPGPLDKGQGPPAAFMVPGSTTGFMTTQPSGAIPATYSTGLVSTGPQPLAYPQAQVLLVPQGNGNNGAYPHVAPHPGQPLPAGWMVPAGGMGPAKGPEPVDPQHTTSTTGTTTAPSGTTYLSGGSAASNLQPYGSASLPSQQPQHPGAPPVPHSALPPQQLRAVPGEATTYSAGSARPGLLSPTQSDATRVLEGMRIAWSDITIQGLLGEGGFGKVYKGSWQGNRVAVKVLSPERAKANVLKELHAEALIMSELRHPCIARVFGLVDEAPHHAIVMAYYRRGTLTRFMQTAAYQDVSLVAKLRMALQVASGMRFLHEKKPLPILHGDLKTSNLLLEDDGRVVIADFGLASTMSSAAAATPGAHSGALTLSISPPEVLSDPHAPRTASADVYAFAVVLLEALTGKPPFRGLKASELKQVVGLGKRPPIPELLPPQVSSLISDCWAQDPAARPSFVAVTERLAAIIQDLEPDHNVLDTTTAVGTYTSHYM